jgi:hypothetical protein
MYLQSLNLTGLVHLKKLRISGGYLVQSEGKLESLEDHHWQLYESGGRRMERFAAYARATSKIT